VASIEAVTVSPYDVAKAPDSLRVYRRIAARKGLSMTTSTTGSVPCLLRHTRQVAPGSLGPDCGQAFSSGHRGTHHSP
jgi:hypothetical protein